MRLLPVMTSASRAWSSNSTSVFKGSILADQSISLNTGASLQGRALARIGGVTLAANSVVAPN